MTDVREETEREKPGPVVISAQTLYQMHLANTARLDALEKTSTAAADSSRRTELGMARIESKLDDALEMKGRLDDVESDLDKAKGGGVVMGVLLAVANLATAVWAGVRIKG